MSEGVIVAAMFLCLLALVGVELELERKRRASVPRAPAALLPAAAVALLPAGVTLASGALAPAEACAASALLLGSLGVVGRGLARSIRDEGLSLGVLSTVLQLIVFNALAVQSLPLMAFVLGLLALRPWARD